MKTLRVGVGSLVLLMVMLHAVEAAVVEYVWDVDYMFSAPDCVEKLLLAVNGQYPSPTLRAVEGDTVVVKITNHIPTEGVVFHWHGMHQVRIRTWFWSGAHSAVVHDICTQFTLSCAS